MEFACEEPAVLAGDDDSQRALKNRGKLQVVHRMWLLANVAIDFAQAKTVRIARWEKRFYSNHQFWVLAAEFDEDGGKKVLINRASGTEAKTANPPFPKVFECFAAFIEFFQAKASMVQKALRQPR